MHKMRALANAAARPQAQSTTPNVCSESSRPLPIKDFIMSEPSFPNGNLYCMFILLDGVPISSCVLQEKTSILRGAENSNDTEKNFLSILLEFLETYNIQVENLCQFLAQDRVVEFARQSNQELLESTEKAVC
uniref:Uncharacterized protein n=1 Tax=Romanomermis culicivorax TaxID=13658 RepID=A0A915KSP8_ROMCU